jgi:hypothetical protein
MDLDGVLPAPVIAEHCTDFGTNDTPCRDTHVHPSTGTYKPRNTSPRCDSLCSNVVNLGSFFLIALVVRVRGDCVADCAEPEVRLVHHVPNEVLINGGFGS